MSSTPFVLGSRVLAAVALAALSACAGGGKWNGGPKAATPAEGAPAPTSETASKASSGEAEASCEKNACISICERTKRADACKEAGYAWRDGSGVEIDFVKAFAAFDRACGKGERYSCHELAKAYSVGEGVKEDIAKAIPLFETACGLGVGQACDDLAKRYEKGEGVAQDHAKAIDLLARGCAAEDYQVWTCTALKRAADKKDKLAERVLTDSKKACKAKDQTACLRVERLTPKDAAAGAKVAPKK